jgi:hypothetical protein
MFNAPPREREWVSWFWVAIWSAFIFLSIPYVRAMQEMVYARWGRQVFTYFVVGSLLIVACAGILKLLLSRRAVSKPGILWLGGVTALTMYSSAYMDISPEEAIHFLEYGFLGLLIFRALSHRLRDAGIYLAAVLVGSLIGAADEFVQWLVPRRFFDFRDIGLNCYALILMQVAMAKGVRPPFISRGFGAASVQCACSLASVLVLVLALFASNNPAAIVWYTARFPSLAHAKACDVMAEYGFLYNDPDIGTFFSRLPPAQLQKQDAERCAEASDILNQYASPDEYESFLEKYTSFNDPFLHEARVHLFRRDHYKAVAWKYEKRQKLYLYHNTVAYRENEILEKYFGRTLHHSIYAWSPEEVAGLKKKIDPAFRYKSEVSSNLFTRFTLTHVWIAALLALVVLAAVRRYYGEQKT